ncbi:monocarboxylate transporter 13-like [Ixodes scapularis]|uniref:monocarboxylate transporter 13-like n=1 Tax=Ixodes scapularis TaxID=6945 RepID=UPI001A9CE402|nr:monocarboxylate transporter 13-like [Ixodes scapularis]
MDSARSWVLAAACAWINIFSFAMFRAAPVIYVGIMGTYHVTRQQAAWPLFITLVIYTTAALGAGLLTRCVAVWKLTLTGCLLSSLSVSVCFFANGIPYLSFFLGVVHGCGIALLTLCNTVISQNFLRYRTVASGISSAGITLGSFLYPVLVQFLFDEYGTRGGLLLCGGVMLNATAGALLHRRPPTAQREPVALFGNAAPRLNCPMIDNRSRLIPQYISDKGSPNTFQDEERFACEMDDCWEKKYLTVCTDVADAEAASDLLKKSDAKALQQAGEPDYRCRTVEGSLQKQHDGVSEPIPVTMNAALVSFLRLPKFYLITVSHTQIMANMSTYITVIVDFAMDRKVSKWDSVFLLLIYATADLLARIGSGWITDKRMLKKSVMMALNFLLWGTSLFLMPLCYSFYLHALLAFLAGWCNGATIIMIPVLLMEHVGLEKFSVCFGASFLLCGLPLLMIPGLIGYFRDSLGNYQRLFFLLGGLTLLNGLLWLRSFSQEKAKTVSEGESKNGSIIRSSHSLQNSEG